ncbi:MAG: hypothetical protein K2X66_08840 [Cyanobacteria bacterium]|nr:hypothetical protein [Cyanobacteriota bacterium]
MYLAPWEADTLLETYAKRVDMSQGDFAMSFHLTMLSIAIPFIYMGCVMTIRRLRSLDLPVPLVILFFLPMINFLLFAVLSILPSKPSFNTDVTDPESTLNQGDITKSALKRFCDRAIPKDPIGSIILGTSLTALLGVLGETLSVMFFKEYGWGLFVGLPFCVGLIPVLIDGYHEKRSFLRCLLISWLATIVLAAALIFAMIEGVVCILMLAPIALCFATVGGIIGYIIQSKVWVRQNTHLIFLALISAMPLLMGAEAGLNRIPPLIAIKTATDIQAPPEKVWHHVVTFSQLPPPTNPLFLYGIAYPIRAEIHGTGVGAVRHCIFSTGPFVEPITVWDEPHLLKFSVAQQPAAMKELSIYPDMKPPHVDDYLRSEGGQFLLTPLPNGGTHLEGTTWYRHRVWPSFYWQMWSDGIIHTIHHRVLSHIKTLSEKEG